jgi:quercetin dioxygenase-like cupin family protein
MRILHPLLLGVTLVATLLIFTSQVTLAEPAAKPVADTSGHQNVQVLNYRDLKWQKIVPELGDASPEIVILHVDPQTQATQLMIRAFQAMHVPKHWHSGDETHTILRGSFVLDCQGVHEELGPGGFNFMPARMVHEAWIKPDKDGFLIFITVNRAWDLHWAEGPPSQKDLGQSPPTK